MPPAERATLTKQQNTQYMLRQWLLPGIAGLAVMLFLGNQLVQDNTLAVAIAVALVAVAGGWAVFGGPVQEGKLLQSATPEPLLAYFDQKLAQAPIADRDASLAFTRALVNTLYGRFDAARAEVTKLDWASRPPLILAQATFLQTWWAYLD
jgi:hypothetical protein